LDPDPNFHLFQIVAPVIKRIKGPGGTNTLFPVKKPLPLNCFRYRADCTLFKIDYKTNSKAHFGTVTIRKFNFSVLNNAIFPI